jgi:filamentous hemagglutinin family protein
MKGTLTASPFVVGFALALATGPVTAQIKTDETLGRMPRVLHGPDYAIGPGLGQIRGPNLFHSFERFNLRTRADGTVESASFSGPGEIERIISRVTGGERSEIDGTIVSTIPGADFFFLNPAGVVFGQSAFLDVQGSFHVSTADELRFATGAKFSASNPDASSLTVAPPEAFGFLSADPAPITVDASFLQVPPGEALSIVGGDIDVGFTDIRAAAGRIILSAVGGPGEAGLRTGAVVADRRGDITLRNQSQLSTDGDGGGTIRIRGGAIVVEDDTVLGADNFGPSDSQGGIEVEGRSLEMRSGAQLTADVGAQGDAGAVTVSARELEMSGGARIRSSSFAAGAAGPVTVEVGRLRIFGDGSDAETGIMSDARVASTKTGDASTVKVTADDIELRDGGEIRSSTFGAGDAGTVQIDAARLRVMRAGLDRLTGISSQVEPEATGEGGTVSVTADQLELRADGKIRSVTFSQAEAGTVTVTADRVTLRGGGQISSSAFEPGTGEGGDVLLTAHEALIISGQSKFRDQNSGVFPPSGVFASTQSPRSDAGAGGTVTVTAPAIRLADRGEISSESFGGGAGGNVRVTTESLEIDIAEITTKAGGAGDGGRIRVRAGVLELRNHGLITAQSTGSGAAGAVTVEVGDRLLLLEGSDVSTESASAGGGNIALRVGDTIVLRDSSVTTSVQGGIDPTAGNILIDPKVLVIDNSVIRANAPEGFGGDIDIFADNAIVPEGSLEALIGNKISASGEVGGSVSLVVGEVTDVAADLLVLEGALLDAASQLRERCGARRDIGASSFTGVGRGGLPPSPDGPLAGAYLGHNAVGGTPGPAADALPEPARSPSRAGAVPAMAPCLAWPETATSSP